MGRNIYSKKSTYFKPRIKYIGLKEGTYKLLTKIYDNKGVLSSNSEISPKGYTNSIVISINKGEEYAELTGWGSNQPGHWPAGRYKIEIWYMDKKIAEKTFNVY